MVIILIPLSQSPLMKSNPQHSDVVQVEALYRLVTIIINISY